MGQWNLGLLARAQLLWPSFLPIPASSLGKCAYFGDEESVELTRLRILESGALGSVFRESAVDSVLSAVGA